MIVGHTTEQSCRSVQRGRISFLCAAAVFFWALCIPGIVQAQSSGEAHAKSDSSSRIPTTMRLARDTTPAVIRWNEDSLIAARTASSDTVMRSKKSATVAMLASMILPGAGQIYNESYWKAPVVWGFAAYFYSAYRIQNNNYKRDRDAYAATVIADSAHHQGNLAIRANRNLYFDDRNKFGWYLAFTYLLTIVDAYVDASLYNFEVSPDLQPHGEWKATLHIRLP